MAKLIKREDKYFIQKKAKEEHSPEECLKVGIATEAKEHPSLDPKTIEQIAQDHIDNDPNYYQDEGGCNEGK
jgi:hypothetical protein